MRSFVNRAILGRLFIELEKHLPEYVNDIEITAIEKTKWIIFYLNYKTHRKRLAIKKFSFLDPAENLDPNLLEAEGRIRRFIFKYQYRIKKIFNSKL